MTESTRPFAVFGLYQDRSVPTIIDAIDHDDARRQYHERLPGWEGTTLYVKDLADLTGSSFDERLPSDV